MLCHGITSSTRCHLSFPDDGVADVEVPSVEIDKRLAAMRTGLVAYDALSQLLMSVGRPRPPTLETAIKVAYAEELINALERNWLLHYDKQASDAFVVVSFVPHNEFCIEKNHFLIKRMIPCSGRKLRP